MEIDWSKAPEWATRLLVNKRDDSYFCWADDDCKAYQLAEPFSCFQLMPEYWSEVSLRPTEWNGEGLPPVGTVCERRASGDLWEKVKIKYQEANICVWEVVGVAAERCTDDAHKLKFRPIRTAEQIAAEERRAAVLEMKGHLSFSDYRVAERHCEQLFDAGYRKVEVVQ